VPDDELSFVGWLRRNNPAHPAIELGVGDDMGGARLSDRRVLLSSDLLLDGVHVDSRVHSYEQIGRKALARTLSDCAAMAARPVCATVSVAFPRKAGSRQGEELFQGIWRLASAFAVGVVGGDTAWWDHPLCVDVAVLAEPFEGIEPVTRAGARAGDRLFVSGSLGGSLLGRHLDFTPCVREAEAIARTLGNGLHAMIDISDGLSLDLWRMCEASGVGAELEEGLLDRVTSEAACRTSAADGRSRLSHVLSDGEDYELLFAASESARVEGLSVFPIGRVLEKPEGMRLLSPDGRVEAIAPRGFRHG